MKASTEPADPKVQITLTIPQAEAMVGALDIYTP